jgi:hypothetical protein
MVKTLARADFTHDVAVAFQTYFAANRFERVVRTITLRSGCRLPVAQRPVPDGGMHNC